MKTFWFDDGLKSTMDIAYPIMQRCNLTGIVALIPSIVGGSFQIEENEIIRDLPVMDLEDLQMLVDSGWEIASHSFTHPKKLTHGVDFCQLNLAETTWELKMSKQWIMDNLGVTPVRFAAPQHSLGPKQVRLVERYYSYIRPIPPTDDEVIWHWIRDDLGFIWKLKERYPCCETDKVFKEIYAECRQKGVIDVEGRRR